jgi:hypothetical protein
VVLRVQWWRTAPASADDAALRCSPRASGLGPGSWSLPGRQLDTAFAREGLFVDRGGGLLLLEVEAPVAQAEALRPLAADWIRAQLQP